jgi:hypothetical protein
MQATKSVTLEEDESIAFQALKPTVLQIKSQLLIKSKDGTEVHGLLLRADHPLDMIRQIIAVEYPGV